MFGMNYGGGKGDFGGGKKGGFGGKPAWGGDSWGGGGGWGGKGKGGGKWGADSWSKGGGKWGGKADWEQPTGGSGMLWQTISEAVATMGGLETQWEPEKLEKKLREYFTKAAKQMDFYGKLPELIDQYADNAIGSIYAGLGDREWLYSGQVDFLLVLDAGIKDFFPSYLLRTVSQSDFEQLVLSSYERAFDEQRFCPILSEKLPEFVSGPKIKKKVWTAIDQGRKDTCADGHASAQDFARAWIDRSVTHLAEATGSDPEQFCPQDQMAELFLALLEGGGLPTALMANAEAPLDIVAESVTTAYSQHAEGAWQPAAGAPATKLRGGMASWGPPNYGGKGAALYARRAAVKAKKDAEYATMVANPAGPQALA